MAVLRHFNCFSNDVHATRGTRVGFPQARQKEISVISRLRHLTCSPAPGPPATLAFSSASRAKAQPLHARRQVQFQQGHALKDRGIAFARLRGAQDGLGEQTDLP